MCIFVIYIEFFPYCLFVSNSQVIGCEDRLQSDLYCVGWGVKLYSVQSNWPILHVIFTICVQWIAEAVKNVTMFLPLGVCYEWENQWLIYISWW